MKTILITGVSSGIGYDAVKFLVHKGYFVFGSVRKESDQIRLEDELPNNFKALTFDVTDKPAIIAAKKQVEAHLAGRSLDVLINNAGIAVPGPQTLLDDEKFRHQLEVNVFGVRYVTNVFAPLLGAYKDFEGKPGKIINISSISGLFNNPFNGSYCVSKHALESLSEVYRREFLIYGIDVVCVNPGPILSEIWDKNHGGLDKYLDSDYGFILEKANQVIEQSKKIALPLEATSKLLYKIINQDKPKLNHLIHKTPWSFRMMKWIPARMMDKMIKNKLSDKNHNSLSI